MEDLNRECWHPQFSDERFCAITTFSDMAKKLNLWIGTEDPLKAWSFASFSYFGVAVLADGIRVKYDRVRSNKMIGFGVQTED